MYLTALDVGSSAIKVLVGELKRDKRLSILRVFKIPSEGVRKGEVVSVDDLSRVLSRAFEEIQGIHKSVLKNIFVNVSGPNVRTQTSKGIVAVSRADSEIYQDDIDRVIKASQAINIGPNRMILHTLTREYVVDGIGGNLDALGMSGNRLEVNALIVDSFKTTVSNLVKSVEAAGGEVHGMVYGPLAASRSILSRAQKDLGVLFIDIGFGTTSVSVYEENQLLSVSVLPIGASNITNDLAIGLRCAVTAAETIKLSFGFALTKEIRPKDTLDLRDIDPDLKAQVSRRFISEVIEERLAEIFELVNNELKLIGKMGRLPAGAVLAGGGAKMPGIGQLAKQVFKLPVHIGTPDFSRFEINNPDLGVELEDPEFAVVAGLLEWCSDEVNKEKSWKRGKKQGWASRWVKYFLP